MVARVLEQKARQHINLKHVDDGASAEYVRSGKASLEWMEWAKVLYIITKNCDTTSQNYWNGDMVGVTGALP